MCTQTLWADKQKDDNGCSLTCMNPWPRWGSRSFTAHTSESSSTPLTRVISAPYTAHRTASTAAVTIKRKEEEEEKHMHAWLRFKGQSMVRVGCKKENFQLFFLCSLWSPKLILTCQLRYGGDKKELFKENAGVNAIFSFML